MRTASYQDLTVWQKSMDLAKEIYCLVRKLPKEENYALSDQMRRAAISIPSNIAEGKERSTDKNLAQFISIASGSNAEVQTQLLLCVQIGYLSEDEIEKAYHLSLEVGRMLHGLKQVVL